jgi:hypothetical protein
MATADERLGEVGRIEHEIGRVREDVGRTVAEIGTRLTPAHLMEQAKQSLKDATVDRTKAVAHTAGELASGVAGRTRDVAMDARDQVLSHPLAAGLIGVGAGFALWSLAAARRNRRRLVPREWDEPFDRSSRRARPRSTAKTVTGVATVASALLAGWLIYQGRLDQMDDY